MEEQGLVVDEPLEVKKKRKVKKVLKKKVKTSTRQTSGDDDLVTSLETKPDVEGNIRSEGASGEYVISLNSYKDTQCMQGAEEGQAYHFAIRSRRKKH